MNEALALLVAERERTGSTHRIYQPKIGPLDVVAIELEIESLEEYEKGWAEFWAAPETAAFIEKWNALTEPGTTEEIWTLAE